MAEHPVFFDPAGKRGRLSAILGGTILGIVSLVVVALLVAAIILKPSLPDFHVEHRATTYRDPLSITDRGTTILAPKLRQALDADVRKASVTAKRPNQGRVVMGFYAPDQSAGLESLQTHAAAMTHLSCEWLHLTADGTAIDYARDYDLAINPRNVKVEELARRGGVRIIPMLDNSNGGDFDERRAARLLGSPALQAKMATEIVGFLVQHRYDGLNLDLEELNGADSKGLLAFARKLQAAFAPHGLSLSVDVEAGNDELDLEALADTCDFIVPMLYDEHSETGAPGSIASFAWSEAALAAILKTVPESKVVMGIGNYGYDWPASGKPAEPLTFQEALTTAEGYRSERPDKVLRFDPASSNTTFAYRDDDDRLHRVWLLDAVSAYNQTLAAGDLGLRGAALWALGEEDPAVWSFFDRERLFRKVTPAALESVSFPYEVSFTGRGEILRVEAKAHDGSRRIAMDANGFVESSVTTKYASPYFVAKSGYIPKKLALTFDDGPDRQWTPEILDELKRLKVPGTFFDIGANVEDMPDLVEREVREGHEIGNHSFTHPDLGTVSDSRSRLEITLTQMALEGATGRSSVLFRPPYNADSEPETPEQLNPVLMADELGYVTVGENVDPEDWNPTIALQDGTTRPRTAEDISDFVVSDVKRREGGEDEGNIILLHDAGGDRAQTVKALTTLVPRLQAMGYRFVPVSELMGRTRAGVMPPISAKDRLFYALGRWGLGTAFEALGWLRTAFVVAIGLGLARVAVVVPLALVQRRRESARSGGDETISVVIAAYNEAPVIARTVASVLASDVPILELIVVDDGSSDGTAERAAIDPRVRVIVKPNGGKASALNLGIAAATGDLLFHIDADTILEPAAVGRLAAHFALADVAAVAGNVQVGNRVNLLTRWQDLEYETSQNLDRRAYANLNCITVIPGAIGMWRRAAVLEVGGYQTDTLAEDMDLTWRLRRKGCRLDNEPLAIAYTEAPERFRDFFKQRFRWSYGTLQCLWKHRRALGRYGWFGWFALPVQWAFGVVFQALAPLIDLQVLFSFYLYAAAVGGPASENRLEAVNKAQGDVVRTFAMYAIFMVAELIAAAIALRLNGKPLRRLWPLVIQRFVYRQMMYAVMYKSLTRAFAGGATGWGKLARTGSVRVPTEAPR